MKGEKKGERINLNEKLQFKTLLILTTSVVGSHDEMQSWIGVSDRNTGIECETIDGKEIGITKHIQRKHRVNVAGEFLDVWHVSLISLGKTLSHQLSEVQIQSQIDAVTGKCLQALSRKKK
jgi:hypothetical protein